MKEHKPTHVQARKLAAVERCRFCFVVVVVVVLESESEIRVSDR